MVETSERFSLMGLLQQNLKIIRSEVHCIKGVLKNFAKFTGKHPCWSFFLNVRLQRLQRMNFEKYLRAPIP